MKPSYLAESLDDSGDVKTSNLVTLRRRDWCFGIKINCSCIDIGFGPIRSID